MRSASRRDKNTWGNVMNNVLKALVILALGVFAGIAPTWAADTCTGVDINVTQTSDTSDLGQGLKKMAWTAQSVVMSNDSIYKLVVGECSFTMLMTPDGKSQSSGYCARHDKDGDTQSISTHQAPGADKIEWKSTGGTGKYAGKQDSGWAQPMFAEGSVIVVKWGGDCH
jgi:hypothetical protein